MTESVTTEIKSMHIAVYLGLCFAAWIIGVTLANVISVSMGGIYAEATVSVVIGFWAGKIALKNKRRDWGGIVAFPIINFIAALLGFSLGHSSESSTTMLICLAIAFMLSCGLFAMLNKKNTVPRHSKP